MKPLDQIIKPQTFTDDLAALCALAFMAAIVAGLIQ